MNCLTIVGRNILLLRAVILAELAVAGAAGDLRPGVGIHLHLEIGPPASFSALVANKITLAILIVLAETFALPLLVIVGLFEVFLNVGAVLGNPYVCLGPERPVARLIDNHLSVNIIGRKRMVLNGWQIVMERLWIEKQQTCVLELQVEKNIFATSRRKIPG